MGKIHPNDPFIARKAELSERFGAARRFGADIQWRHHDAAGTAGRLQRDRMGIYCVHPHAHVRPVPLHAADRLIDQAPAVYRLEQFCRDHGFKSNFSHVITLFFIRQGNFIQKEGRAAGFYAPRPYESLFKIPLPTGFIQEGEHLNRLWNLYRRPGGIIRLHIPA